MAKKGSAPEMFRPMRAIARRDWLVERAEQEVALALDYLEARVTALRLTPGFPKIEARATSKDLLLAAFRVETAMVAAETARHWHQHFNYGLDAEMSVPVLEKCDA